MQQSPSRDAPGSPSRYANSGSRLEVGSRSSHAGQSTRMTGGLHKSGSPAPQHITSQTQGSLSPSIKRSTDSTALSRSPGRRAAGSPLTRPKLTVAQYQSATAGELQSEVQQVQDALCADQTAYNRALEYVQKSKSRIQQLTQQVKSLQDEDAALSVKVPLPINRLCRVRQWLSEKVTALDAEQATLEGKQMALLKAESKLRAQETQSSLLDDVASSLNTATAAETAAAARAAAVKHDSEVAAATRKLTQMVASQREEQQRVADEQTAADKLHRVAAQSQALAIGRLSASQASIKAGAAAAAKAASSQHSKHLDSLVQFKAKVDEVRESMSKNAEKTRQLRKQKKEQEQREFEALQEQGLNPYEVYRVRDAEVAAARAAAQQAARQTERQAEIAAALEAEERAHRKRLAKQEFDRQVEENYQRQMGITAQQQRTDAYMRAHTLTHQAILNPTSRMPVHPSEAVLVKPVGFGLGRSSPEAVRKVAGRHGKGAVDLQDCLLLPSKYRLHPLDVSDAAQAQTEDAFAADLPSDSDADAASDADGPDSEEARDVDSPSTAFDSSSSGLQRPGRDAGSGSSGQEHSAGRQRHGGRSQLQVTKLSKFEAGRLEQAKQRHKAQIAQPKAAFGRVFAGDAFISEPPAIEFKDFAPGQTYRMSVQLINRSFTGSSIRLLEVPTEVMHVLELDMPPPGCLAPGASATLKVTFRPLADQALSASIPLLADSGPLSLPFRALVRQALPSIDSSPVVSVDGRAGGVMLGASAHANVTVSNAGVLAMLYWIKVTGPLAATTEYTEPPGPVPPADASEADLAALQAQAWAAASLSVAGVTVHGVKGQVQGYSSCNLRVEFTPRVAGPVEVPVLVSFTAPDNSSLAIPPIALTLTATGKELPVSCLTPVVDFKCVMFGRTYAAPLLLANAGKSAMKVLMSARPELADWITFTPDFGFIQSSDTLAISVALKPTPDMRHKFEKYLLLQQEDCYEIPLQVTVPGQPLPLPVKLRLQATTSDLVLGPKTLDFGRVPLPEAAGVYITIINTSALPQGFSFGSKLPLGLELSPNSGYGRVLPHETVKLLATFQPPIPGLQYFDLTCRTLAGRVFKLEGKCDGLQPEVTLSHNVIKFPATACEDSSSASLIVRNTSSDCSSVFEFGVPTGSHIKVTPRVGMLQPQSSVRVQVDFSPPASQQQPATTAHAATATATDQGPKSGLASGAAAASSAASTTAGQQQQQQQQNAKPGLENEPDVSKCGGQFQEWLLPCFIKHIPSSAADSHSSNTGTGAHTINTLRLAGGTNMVTTSITATSSISISSTSGSSSSSSSGADYVLHVSVATCAIRPELQLVSPQLCKPPGKNYWVLDFGALPVGGRTTRELVLQNTGDDVADLRSAPLDPLVGAFSLVNALRPLDPSGGQGRVLLAFEPPDCCEYQEILTLRSAKSRLRVCLKGRGIAPTLAITPASAAAAAGGLAFGDVLLSDPTCKELKKVQVTNTCPFTVNYSTRFIGPVPQHAAAAAVQAEGKAAGAAGAAAAAGVAAAASGSKPPGIPPVATAAATAAAGAGVGAAKPPGAAGAAGQPQAAASSTAAAPAAAAATAECPSQPSGCFICKPSGGVLQAGQTQELTVVFAPLGSAGAGACGSRGPCGPLSPYVADRLQILVPHQQQDVVVPLQGNAWPDGVFVAGAVYKSSSSSSSSSTTITVGTAAAAAGSKGLSSASTNTAAGGPVQDPFAAIMLAAAAASAATAVSAGSGAQGPGKGKQSAAAAAAAAAASAAQQQEKMLSQRGASLQPKDLASALAAAGYCDLTQGYITLNGPIHPGQVSTAVVDFGAIKSSAGGAAGELVVEELPAEAKAAGWSVDPMKLSVPAGEKRPLTIRFTAPEISEMAGTQLGALGQLQVPVQQVLRLGVVMKGGCTAMPGVPAAVPVAADGSWRLSLVCSCVLAPAVEQAGAAAAAAGVAGSAMSAAAPAAAAGKK